MLRLAWILYLIQDKIKCTMVSHVIMYRSLPPLLEIIIFISVHSIRSELQYTTAEISLAIKSPDGWCLQQAAVVTRLDPTI